MLAAVPGFRALPCVLCDAELHLVESDQKKAVFLQTVIRETGIQATSITSASNPSHPSALILLPGRWHRLIDFSSFSGLPRDEVSVSKGCPCRSRWPLKRSDITYRLRKGLTNPRLLW